ncbi:MAG: type IV pilus twitching motility protein PilT [Candidatus Krumholzibacteriia bacterium]
MPRIDAFLQVMQQYCASDLHIGDGAVPMLRIQGVLEKTKHKPLSMDEVRVLLYELLTDTQIERFETEGELDVAYTLPGVARFRMSMFRKHPGLAAAFRMIPVEIPTLDELGFPPILKKLLSQRSGLILVTGPANSGKSTTLAAMVDYLNDRMNYHIITLEDPLEFIHTNRNCLINQRQIGEHSRSFASALRSALREDPNVVLVGEMRDNETISLALTAAQVGLLVLATLHTKSAAQTVSRIVDSYSADQQPQVRLALSEVLEGICSQQLLRRADGSGRIAALEVMVRSHAIANLIREAKSHLIKNAIMTGKKEGMQLLDQHLRELIAQKIVTPEEAALYSEDPQAILAYAYSGVTPQTVKHST